jgi:hypothetical protein
MKRLFIPVLAVMIISFLSLSPAFAQRGNGGGGRPSGAGAPTGVDRGPFGPQTPSAPGVPSHGTGSGNGTSHDNTSLSHSSPTDVLSHNTAIADKIGNLTGKDPQVACSGFKNLGECVAAAHVAENLNIAGGFDALKTQMQSNGMNLGKAIQSLDSHADVKAESKKANKQANDDLKSE